MRSSFRYRNLFNQWTRFNHRRCVYMIPLIPLFHARCDVDTEHKYNSLYHRWGRDDLFECMDINKRNSSLKSEEADYDQIQFSTVVNGILMDRMENNSSDQIVFCHSSSSLDDLLRESMKKIKDMKYPPNFLKYFKYKRHYLKNEWNKAIREISVKIDQMMLFIKEECIDSTPISWSIYLCGVDKYDSAIIHICGPVQIYSIS